MRIAPHDHRAVADVREEHARDRDVVTDQIALRDAELGPEGLVQVGDALLLPVDLDDRVAPLRDHGQRCSKPLAVVAGSSWRPANEPRNALSIAM